jgi:hypothetical protein
MASIIPAEAIGWQLNSDSLNDGHQWKPDVQTSLLNTSIIAASQQGTFNPLRVGHAAERPLIASILNATMATKEIK